MTDTEDKVPSENLRYGNQPTFGVITSRKEVTISPKYGGEFRAGSIIRFELPAQDYVDPEYIRFNFRTFLFAGAGNNWVTSAGHVPLASTSGIPFLGDERLQSSNANCNKTVKFKPGVQCIFNRIKVLAGSTTIEDIQDYGDLQRFLLEATSSFEWRESDGIEKEGFYDPEDVKGSVRASNQHCAIVAPNYTTDTYTSVGYTYTVRPFLGILRGLNKILPVKYIGNITFEFYMEENAQCLWSTSSARCTTQHYALPAVAPVIARVAGAPTTAVIPTVFGRPQIDSLTTITNSFASGVTGVTPLSGHITTDFPNAYYTVDKCEMIVPFVTVAPEYDAMVQKSIEESGVDLHFSSFHTHIKQISSAGRQNLNFTERSLSVKGGYVLMKYSEDLRDIRSDVTFVASNIEQYQWKIGNEYFPPQVVDCTLGGGRAYDQLQLALGTYKETNFSNCIRDVDYHPVQVVGNVMTQDPWELKRKATQPSKFAIGLSLEKSAGQISGFDSAAAGVDIELQLTLGTMIARFPVAYAATQAFLGNFGSGQFTTSKFFVSITSSPSDVSATNTVWAMPEYYGLRDHGGVVNQQNTSMSEFSGVQAGIMMPKNLTALHTWNAGATYATGLLTIPAFSNSLGHETGKYIRLAFYAHVESILRIRRVGQIEVVV